MTTSNNRAPDPQLDALLAEAGWVLALAKRLARDQAAAEDIAQSTLALALEQRPSVRDGLRPWLASVAVRLARRNERSDSRRRAREQRATSGHESRTQESAEVQERFELQQDLANRVRALPEPYRRVLVLRFYSGLSVKQIAAEVGASPATVRSQLARGLERVRVQYPHSHERGALGAFLIVAGSSPNLLSPNLTKVLCMQATSKLALAAGAALVLTVAFFGFRGDSSADGLRSGVEAPLATSAPALAEGKEDSQALAMESEGGRLPVEQSLAASGAAANGFEEDPVGSVTTVRARVLGENLKPIAGATMRSIYLDGRSRGARSSASSDGDGRVQLELPDDSVRRWREEVFDMVFEVSAPEHATAFLVKQPKLHGDTDLGEVQLALGGTLEGLAVDGSGRPVAGAILFAGGSVLTGDLDALRLRGPEHGVTRPRAVSGVDGRFQLAGMHASLPSGKSASTRIWAQAPGFLWTVTEAFSLTPRGVVDVGTVVLDEIEPEQRIAGTVLRPNGMPAPGARVDFSSQGTQHNGHVLADANGDYLVLPRTAHPMELVAWDPGDPYGMSASQIAERGVVVDLQLRAPRSMTVKVVDLDGEPTVDAHVMPVLADADPDSSSYGRLVPGVKWFRTDVAGEIRIPVPAQRFLVAVRTTGSGSWHQGPFEHESAPEQLTVHLPRGPQISGRVLAYGEPVAGARVYAMRRYEGFAAMTGGFPNRYWSGASSIASDAQGRFVAPLKPDWTAVGVLATHPGYALGEATSNPTGDGDIEDIEVHLTVGGAIEGVVIPPQGRAAAGLYVAASRGDGKPLSTRVNAAGEYRFEGLTPGPWRVEGRLREARTEVLSTSEREGDLDPRWNAHVVDRETLRLEVDMRHLVDVDVQGQLLIDGAAPPSGWAVAVVPPRETSAPEEATVVQLDQDGRFAFTTRAGRKSLRFAGSLPGGTEVEMFREIDAQGDRLEWEGRLVTATLSEVLELGDTQARFIRGRKNGGDGEVTTVPVVQGEVWKARVPVGWSLLQVPARGDASEQGWEDVRQLEVR